MTVVTGVLFPFATQSGRVPPAGSSPTHQGRAPKRQKKWRWTVPVLQITAERKESKKHGVCAGGAGVSEDTLHFVLAFQGLVQTCLTSQKKTGKRSRSQRLSIAHWGTAQVNTPEPEKQRHCHSALVNMYLMALTLALLGK